MGSCGRAEALGLTVHGPTSNEDPCRRVWEVLNRTVTITALDELRAGMGESLQREPIEDSARILFGFDTNAIYRLGLNGTAGAEAVDYLRQQHQSPLILPGQAVQELWNNVLAAVEPQAKKMRQAFGAVEREMNAIDEEIGPRGEQAKKAIQDFLDAHGDWIDPDSQRTFDGTLDALSSVASVPYVPRTEFAELGRVRKQTKTPPGYQDESANYGDFFVWADFLLGVANADPSTFDAVIFVTNETKSDWRRNDVPHPILVAEVRVIAPVPFGLWDVTGFQKFVKRLSNS